MAPHRQRFARIAVCVSICLPIAPVARAEEQRQVVENLFHHVVDVNSQRIDAKPPIFPAALKPGDLIEIIAPAKYLDKERVTLATKRLEEMGFKVRHPKNLFRKKGFLGGTDEERAAELMAAFADPEVKAIMPGTGGYGTTRIIDDLDYDTIRKNPKILVGFSDITGLHIAINQRTGLVTFHSPLPEWGLGIDKNLSPFAAKWFWRAILAKEYPAGDIGYTIFTHAAKPPRPDDATLFEDVPAPVTMHGGKARGRLIGGNLSVLHAMMGSPYEIQTAGKILFLEDVGEAPYRIDRMLSTLKLAGKFDHVAAVILGRFTAREKEPKWDDDESMDDVLNDYFASLGIPVVNDFPIGHVRYNATLPEGAMAELDADAQTLRLLENPVSP
jgi:muramoyltetrapeptide carboxypeptidase